VKVLVACEFSGTVRDAFAARGHKAVSCDLLPSSKPGLHIIGDVLNFVNDGYDLIIAHPPCTHLASSGARWFKDKQKEQDEAIAFVLELARADCPRIAIENPVGVLSTRWRKPDQIVQPWWFGDEATKSTCLWLKGLPLLVADKVVGHGERHVTKSGKSLPKWYNLPPSPDRWMKRSITFPGFARAMAEQWG
jgi:site-specific DNA-cytosine methylase